MNIQSSFYNHFKKIFNFSDKSYHVIGVIATASIFSLYHLLKMFENRQADEPENEATDEFTVAGDIHREEM